MFNRSIKYIFLLFINIVVLFVLYVDKDEERAGIFDTQFVIELLDERDSLQEALIEAEMAQLQAEKSLTETTLSYANVDTLVQQAEQKFERCETARAAAQESEQEQAAQLISAQDRVTRATAEIDNLENLLAKQNEQIVALKSSEPVISVPEVNAPEALIASCDTQEAALTEARQALARTRVQIEQQEASIAELESLISQASQNTDADALVKEIEALEKRIAKLEADIENPIYLKSVYLSGKKCEKPNFEGLVCVQELLVRPQFSKAPTTEVTVSIYSPDDRKVASGNFASDRAQLFRFPLGRGQELREGEFSARFEVEGELLASTGHIIAH